MTAHKPIFEFRPFERPLGSFAALTGFTVLCAMTADGGSWIVGYLLYLPVVILPFAVWWRAKQWSEVAKKIGAWIVPASWLGAEWQYLPPPRLPRVVSWPRVLVASANWLIILPACAILTGMAFRVVWS